MINGAFGERSNRMAGDRSNSPTISPNSIRTTPITFRTSALDCRTGAALHSQCRNSLLSTVILWDNNLNHISFPTLLRRKTVLRIVRNTRRDRYDLTSRDISTSAQSTDSRLHSSLSPATDNKAAKNGRRAPDSIPPREAGQLENTVGFAAELNAGKAEPTGSLRDDDGSDHFGLAGSEKVMTGSIRTTGVAFRLRQGSAA